MSCLLILCQGNVLVSHQGDALVADFGISRLLAAGDTALPTEGFSEDSQSLSSSRRTIGQNMTLAAFSKTNIGTQRWCSPEQFTVQGDNPVPFNEWTDVWAFGMTVLVS